MFIDFLFLPATFAGVSLDKVGTNYQLQVTDSSATPLTALSNPFNIIPGAPTLVFTTPAAIGTQSFTFEIPITTTPNTGTQAQNADYITLATSFPQQTFVLGGKTYTLALTGFGNVDTTNGLLANNNTELHVFEGKGGGADLFGKVTLASNATPEPSQSLALAIGALGLAGLAVSRRRKNAAAAV